MRGADRRAVRALLDGELNPTAEAALRDRAATDPTLGAYLRQMEALHARLRAVPQPEARPRPFDHAAVERAREPLFSWRLAALAAAVIVGALTAATLLQPEVAPSPQVAVEFQLVAPDAQQVEVAGDFSGWQPVPLAQVGGAWRGQLKLWPGRYAYMYRVDGRWTTDPEAHSFRDDDFGRRNAVLHL